MEHATSTANWLKIVCVGCSKLRGSRSFPQDRDNGDDMCLYCIQDAEREKWLNGTIIYRYCYNCEMPKNKFTEYKLNHNGLVLGQCISCAKAEARISKWDIKCTNNFIFDEQKFCLNCSTVKSIDEFVHGRFRCKLCINGTPTKKVYKPQPINSVGDVQCKKCWGYKSQDKFYACATSVYNNRMSRVCKVCRNVKSKENEDTYKCIGAKAFTKKFNSHWEK